MKKGELPKFMAIFLQNFSIFCVKMSLSSRAKRRYPPELLEDAEE